jgi:hypothetical protein
MVCLARRFKETDGGNLLPLQMLAAEYHMRVRTLRKAAQDGRLQATFSTRMAFGKPVAFASREGVEQFKRRLSANDSVESTAKNWQRLSCLLITTESFTH